MKSHLAMDWIKQELFDGKSSKMANMYSAITASQRAIEVGINDQTRYREYICENLIVEQREMAQKLAEERGR